MVATSMYVAVCAILGWAAGWVLKRTAKSAGADALLANDDLALDGASAIYLLAGLAQIGAVIVFLLAALSALLEVLL